MSAEGWLLIGVLAYVAAVGAVHVLRVRESYRQGYKDGVNETEADVYRRYADQPTSRDVADAYRRGQDDGWRG